MRFVSPKVIIDISPSPGHGLKRQGSDKFFGSAREDHIHLCAGLRELGSQVGGFVGRDGAGHPERNALVGKDRHITSLYFQEKASNDSVTILLFKVALTRGLPHSVD